MHDQKHKKISKWWPLIIYMMRKRIMVGIGAWDPDPTYQIEDMTSWACREIIMAREPEKSFDHHHLLWWISSIFRLNWQLYSCIYLSSYFRKRDPLGLDEMTLRTDSASVLWPVHTFWHSDPTMHTIWVNLLQKAHIIQEDEEEATYIVVVYVCLLWLVSDVCSEEQSHCESGHLSKIIAGGRVSLCSH